MNTRDTWQAAARIARSPGMGVILLTLGWLAFDQTAGWGQKPANDPAKPVLPKVVKVKPNAAAMSVDQLKILQELADGTRAAQFGGGGFSGGFGGFTPPQRFPANIPPNTPEKSLLPTPPAPRPNMYFSYPRDLSQVPEILFEKHVPVRPLSEAEIENKSEEEKVRLRQAWKKALRDHAVAHAAHTLGKINHLNKQDPDRIVQLLQEHRADLAGLPFMMGDACRMKPLISRQFITEVRELKPFPLGFQGGFQGGLQGGFSGIVPPNAVRGETTPSVPTPLLPSQDDTERARIAARVQILGPMPHGRRQLVHDLTPIEHEEATRALARLAIFSLEHEARNAAIAALAKRPKEPATAVLLDGLRYPWPAVAENAAEAIARLKRTDLAPRLVDVLDEPDPRAPVIPNDGCTPVVREVVRLNHQKNCILCHAPATSDPGFNKAGISGDFLSAPVPVPSLDQAPQPFGYGFQGPSLSPDIFLRIDVTYLRQDFSLMQRCLDDQGKQTDERFDFLVRTRAASPKDVSDHQAWARHQGATYQSPYHKAAHLALRELTGHRNTVATAAAWRKALDIE